MLHFIVRTGPASMQSDVRFVMSLRMKRKGFQNSIRQIQEELRFNNAFPYRVEGSLGSYSRPSQRGMRMSE